MAQDIDPLLDGISPDLDEPTVDAPAPDQVLADAAGVEEPHAGDAPAASGPADGPLAQAALAAGFPVPDEQELAARAEQDAHERVQKAESELAEARRALAQASLRVTSLRTAPTLEECNAAAARIDAELARARAEANAPRIVSVVRKVIPPLPNALLG